MKIDITQREWAIITMALEELAQDAEAFEATDLRQEVDKLLARLNNISDPGRV